MARKNPKFQHDFPSYKPPFTLDFPAGAMDMMTPEGTPLIPLYLFWIMK